VPTMRIASPERWWRVASAPVIAALIGWVFSGAFRVYGGPAPDVPITVRIVITSVAFVIGAALAVLVARSHLTVDEEGLADHRAFRVVRVPWQSIVGFEINRPSGPWGGFCITAVCHDRVRVDLLSVRAYSRAPSAWHLDELQRICWSLEEAARKHAGS
jgi:hypothetical protein